MIAGIYCEPENIDRHLNLETNGMVYCQHCYRELQTKNKKLIEALDNIIENEGRVCAFYEICTHIGCQSSYNAWAIAKKALEDKK